jgi:DNA-binding MarR family transcriptional regulator
MMARPENALNVISNLDQGIHNPARLMIVFLLARTRSLDYIDLMRQTNLTSGNITTHLNKLESSGYIVLEKSFVNKRPNTRIHLTPKGRKAYLGWGEGILCALPEQTRKQLLETHTKIMINGFNRLLCLREFAGQSQDWQYPYKTQDYFVRGLIQPPLDETGIC